MPRVEIAYDVELYGVERKVVLPFVMGVLADLSGTPAEPVPYSWESRFLEIDIDNFDNRMAALKPRVAFHVPNVLSGEGNMAIELTFASIDDFSPAAVARNVEALSPLLDARMHLSILLINMDGKTGAEALLAELLHDRAVLQALAGTSIAQDDSLSVAATLDIEPFLLELEKEFKPNTPDGI